MGTGRFAAGKFDMTAIGNFALTAGDWTAWERAFGKASEILWNLSEGQMSFGRIFVCDDSIGLDTADLILYPDGDPSYSSGTFGMPGDAVHLMPYVQSQVLSILHEMGHSVWNLGDEYCQPYLEFDIDTSSPAPNRRTIPLIDTGRPDNELTNQDADALLEIDGQWERHAIVADTATSITVDSNFSDLPTNADRDEVYVQIPAECSDVANSNYCIMEKSRTWAGYFDNAGNWINVPHPVTEFCTASNHDLADSDTAQEDRHHKSCWETVTDRAEFATLAVPDPASGVLPAGHVGPDWIVLEKQPRFALVLDRSYSMRHGHKMADAQYGAVYWLEHCAEGNDLLTIIWYDDLIDRILDLTQVNTLPDLDAVIRAINRLNPRGNTNIRDGLYEALNQIQGPGTRAAVQVALLLTDGKHNRPVGSAATEVLPDFNEGGVRIFTLGVGEPTAVRMDPLDDLADETGGRSYAVGDDQPGDIQAAMIEINGLVRGGIITTVPQSFPDSREMELDELIEKILAYSEERRPEFAELCDILGLGDVKELAYPKGPLEGLVASIPVEVEKTCERVTFSLVYPEDRALWLYLQDPGGNMVDMNSWPVRHVISSVPHEFAIVQKPEPGRWHMIALRADPGPAFNFKAIAGAENGNIQAFGGAPSRNPARAPVRIWASARFQHNLSGLRVRATVTSPSGATFRVALTDDKIEEPNSGEYEGFLSVEEVGRYRGTIQIVNTGKAIIAKPARRLMDAEDGDIKLSVEAPKFVRVIPFYFDSGERPEVKEEEEEGAEY